MCVLTTVVVRFFIHDSLDDVFSVSVSMFQCYVLIVFFLCIWCCEIYKYICVKFLFLNYFLHLILTRFLNIFALKSINIFQDSILRYYFGLILDHSFFISKRNFGSIKTLNLIKKNNNEYSYFSVFKKKQNITNMEITKLSYNNITSGRRGEEFTEYTSIEAKILTKLKFNFGMPKNTFLCE